MKMESLFSPGDFQVTLMSKIQFDYRDPLYPGIQLTETK